MSGIVCAVRGGPASQVTIEEAIVLAKETGLPLYFLYVVNLDFMTHTSTTRVHTISQEMHQMGEFIVLAAQAQASSEGINAEGVIRHGRVGQEIVTLCQERNADYLILGRPKFQREESVFTQERLARFIQDTQEQTGAQVVMPEGAEE